jgi:bilirubin oxidase
MRNARNIPGNAGFAATDRVMRFIVGNTVCDNTNGALPSTLRYIPRPPQTDVTKNFAFTCIGKNWLVNGVGWVDIEYRISTRSTLGADEIWELRNGNGDVTDVHPVHIHLVDFPILSRIGGRSTVLP